MGDPVAGALAAGADRLGSDATGVLARLAGSLGVTAREMAHTLDEVDGTARTRLRAELAAAARAPVPAGLRLVHPTWIEAALAELPSRARTAIASPGGAALDVWLARWATAAVPPMPTAPLTDLERVIAREPEAVLAWLAGIGADQLAFALGPAAAAHPLLAAAARRIAQPPRHGALGPKRAAIARCRGITLDDGSDALLVVAGRALAPQLVDAPLARVQLTRRLPYLQGKRLEHELVTHASITRDHVPTWAALLAP